LQHEADHRFAFCQHSVYLAGTSCCNVKTERTHSPPAYPHQERVSRTTVEVTPNFYFLQPRHTEPQGDSRLAEQQGSRDTVLPPPTEHAAWGSWEAAGRHARQTRARIVSRGLRLGYSAHKRDDPGAADAECALTCLRKLVTGGLPHAAWPVLCQSLACLQKCSNNLAALLMQLITPCLSRLITAHRDHRGMPGGVTGHQPSLKTVFSVQTAYKALQGTHTLPQAYL